jgi:Divergent InlB B-repeat domain/PASTA domain
MHRLINHAGRLASFALVAFALVLALPALASAATQTLTVEKAGTGTGTVVSSPAGINCGLTCSHEFEEGKTITLAGSPGPNSGPVKWSGCDSLNGENKCLVTMGSAKKTVTATFPPIQRELKVIKTGSGTVTSSPSGIECGSTCSAPFSQGEAVTLTAVSGPGSEPVKWSGCGSIVEGKCTVTMSIDRTVKATFEAHMVELKVKKGGLGDGTVTSEPAGINCGATCSAKFAEASTVTLSGKPTGESQAALWSGCNSVTAENKCLVTMTGAREVSATFNVEGPLLTLSMSGSGSGTVSSSPAGLQCGESCAVTFPKGQLVTLQGTPGLHSQAVKWTGCDETTKANECIVTMSEARAISASFDLEPQYIEYVLTVNPKGTGTGSVQSFPPGISCPPDCSESYVFKTPVTLFATADAGSEFFRWSGGSCSGSGPCERKINSDRTVNAVFKAVGNRTLTVAKAGAGQGVITSKPAAIECGSTCSAELDASIKVALHATAAPGSTFSGWSGEGCSGTGSCKVLMNEARNVTATFAKNPSPPETKCHVPRLRGKTLAKARRALSAAHCAVGRVRRPKGEGKLVVRSSKPGAGARRPAGTPVKLRLTRKR